MFLSLISPKKRRNKNSQGKTDEIAERETVLQEKGILYDQLFLNYLLFVILTFFLFSKNISIKDLSIVRGLFGK